VKIYTWKFLDGPLKGKRWKQDWVWPSIAYQGKKGLTFYHFVRSIGKTFSFSVRPPREASKA